MNATDIFSRFPRQVRFSLQQPQLFYLRRPGCALFTSGHPTPPPGAAFSLNDGAIAVYLTPPASLLSLHAQNLCPIYSLGSEGPVAVPTGLILVRFKENVPAESRRADLERFGYSLVEALSYAPQAAWIQNLAEDIAQSLLDIPKLEQLDGIDNVEPQMLQESRRRQA